MRKFMFEDSMKLNRKKQKKTLNENYENTKENMFDINDSMEFTREKVDEGFNQQQSSLKVIEDVVFENVASSSSGSRLKNCLMDISPIKYHTNSTSHNPGNIQISEKLLKPDKKRNIFTSSPQLAEETSVVLSSFDYAYNSSCDLQKIDISSIASSRISESVELCPRKSLNKTVNSEEIVPGSITGLDSGNHEGYLFQKSLSEIKTSTSSLQEKSLENQELPNQVKDVKKDRVVDDDIPIDPLLTCPVSEEAAKYLLVEFE